MIPSVKSFSRLLRLGGQTRDLVAFVYFLNLMQSLKLHAMEEKLAPKNRDKHSLLRGGHNTEVAFKLLIHKSSV